MLKSIGGVRWWAFVCGTVGVVGGQLAAQSELTEHTFALDRDSVVAAAKIADAAFLAGHWEGEGMGDMIEEIWNKPRGKAMLGSYRLIRDDQPVRYQLCLMIEEQGTLVYKVKRFHPDLTAWERKDDFLLYDLVKVEPGALYFHGLTIQKTDEGRQVYLARKQSDGSYQETEFTYRPAEE